ncbi:hypothetical protein IC744_05580 [Microbacterium hominis]|uniref:hypothetical protein n=1 Tax=Microbacterium TaxID=33882 RepID=UPI00168AD5B8|nr:MULTISPECIES: hypothetical protein [Microbacterium]QOC25830.1 hypothetical protein IC745_16240 [Microbacterium hominis]QOC29814.1 hypothetical protein IC744_05580 [Microbacterium hominis]QYF97796.1 hypothetical protein KY498_00580 [Microbacterium sp. PAMC21962]
MLRVYLDQNKWIDLARAATGHPQGTAFIEALAAARAAVVAGTVVFPLDLYRYWETSKRSHDRSRNDVVDVMRELAQQQTMALPLGILDMELDAALQRRFGRPESLRQQTVFGTGLRHITGDRINWPEPDYSALPGGGASIPGDRRSHLELALIEVIEEHLHRAGPDTFRAAGFDLAAADHGKRFVEFENKVAASIAEYGLTGGAVDQAVRGADLGDIRPAVTQALGRIGVTWDEFVDHATVADLMRFMDDLPTRYVSNVMRSDKHRQTEQKWEPNDFIDVVALPVAAVYCDVVVTERQWVHRLRQGHVDQRYDTVLLSNTADLVNVLATEADSTQASV